MFCEELGVQLGCTIWPQLLQSPLGRLPGGCSWEGMAKEVVSL